MYISYDRFKADVESLGRLICMLEPKRIRNKIFGIPRGGSMVALELQKQLGEPFTLIDKFSDVDDQTIVVDDITDSGKTMEKFLIAQTNILYMSLYVKPHAKDLVDGYAVEVNEWLDFFYENKHSDIEDNIVRIIEHIGENPKREGLLDTPNRVKRMYEEVFSGYKANEEYLYKSVFTSDIDEMVVIKDIPFYSYCEHHMVPFMGKVHIGYIPKGKVLGLSKFARLVDIYAHRLQIQENMTKQIADSLQKHLEATGIMVVVEAEHLCMSMRGCRKPFSKTVTSVTYGAFRDNDKARAEFLSLIKEK